MAQTVTINPFPAGGINHICNRWLILLGQVPQRTIAPPRCLAAGWFLFHLLRNRSITVF